MKIRIFTGTDAYDIDDAVMVQIMDRDTVHMHTDQNGICLQEVAQPITFEMKPINVRDLEQGAEVRRAVEDAYRFGKTHARLKKDGL